MLRDGCSCKMCTKPRGLREQGCACERLACWRLSAWARSRNGRTAAARRRRALHFEHRVFGRTQLALGTWRSQWAAGQCQPGTHARPSRALHLICQRQPQAPWPRREEPQHRGNRRRAWHRRRARSGRGAKVGRERGQRGKCWPIHFSSGHACRFECGPDGHTK